MAIPTDEPNAQQSLGLECARVDSGAGNEVAAA